MTTVSFGKLWSYSQFSNRGLLSLYVDNMDGSTYLLIASWSIVLNVIVRRLVLYSNMFCKVYMMLHVSNTDQCFLVFSTKSSNLVSLGILLIHLLVIKSAYILYFTRKFT